MNIAYIEQLCAYSALLAQKQKELLTATKEQWPRAKVNKLKEELAGLYQVLREIRAANAHSVIGGNAATTFGRK